MISQLLSHVLDERDLIGWLPQWGEFLWIQLWAIAGGKTAPSMLPQVTTCSDDSDLLKAA